MKNKELYLKLCMLLILCNLPMLQTHATERSASKSPITIKGVWVTPKRSISSIPFTASISDNQLFIECVSPNYDICITIIDAYSESVIQRNYSAPETSFVSISLDDLSQGNYTIVISNDYGGRLWATFQL